MINSNEKLSLETTCIHSLLREVFAKDTVQYINAENWMIPQDQVTVSGEYIKNTPYSNFVFVMNDSKLEDVFHQFGYDKRIFVIARIPSKVNYKDFFLKAWLKYRTKLAFLLFLEKTVDFITNIYIKNYEFCPYMFYKETKNVCSHSMTTRSVKFSIKNYCNLRISYVNVHPFVNSVSNSEKGGIMVSWMRTFGAIRKFKIDFVRDSSLYMEEFLNIGTFRKLVAALIENKEDVAIGHLFMNSSDDYPVDFGPIIYNDKLGFIHRKFQKISDFNRMIVVFDKDVWYYLASTFCIVVPVYYYFYNSMEAEKMPASIAFSDIFRLSIGSSVHLIPKSLPLRIIFATFCLFGITFSSTYLGKLSAIFMNPPIDKKEDIYGHGVRIHISYIMETLTNISMHVRSRNDVRFRKRGGSSLTNKTVQELLKIVSILKKKYE